MKYLANKEIEACKSCWKVDGYIYMCETHRQAWVKKRECLEFPCKDSLRAVSKGQVAKPSKPRDPRLLKRLAIESWYSENEQTTECSYGQRSPIKNLDEKKAQSENPEYLQQLESGAFGKVEKLNLRDPRIQKRLACASKPEESIESKVEKMMESNGQVPELNLRDPRIQKRLRLQAESKPVESIDSRYENTAECIDVQMSSPEDPEELKFENLESLQLLGKGAYGQVFLSRDKTTSKYYAVKKLHKLVKNLRSDANGPIRENRILKSISHPFLVSLEKSYQDKSNLFFVMEFANGGDLFYHKATDSTYRFSEERTKFYAAEITLAMSYLHDQGIIYRDLKLENVLMDKQGHIKIADFGLSKDGMSRDSRTKTLCGTNVYIAPEVICKGIGGYGFSADWWSLGIIIYEMLIGFVPFSGNNNDEVYRAVVEQDLEFPRVVSFEAEDLIRGLLVKDPSKRLTEREVVVHEFFWSIDWKMLYYGEIQPPFVAELSSESDLRYFDPDFTEDESVGLFSDNNSSKTEIGKCEYDFEGFDFISKDY